MDQCKGCVAKGNIHVCEKVECSYHELWMVDQLKGQIERLTESLSCIVLNAVIGPDAAMGGSTDCYHVPLDDIGAARSLLGIKP